MVAGTPFFELRTASGARTHVGVLEYSAAEGTVALPLQVIRSLWGPDATLDAATGLLRVKFVRLNKGMQDLVAMCIRIYTVLSRHELGLTSLLPVILCKCTPGPSTPVSRCTAQGRMSNFSRGRQRFKRSWATA